MFTSTRIESFVKWNERSQIVLRVTNLQEMFRALQYLTHTAHHMSKHLFWKRMFLFDLVCFSAWYCCQYTCIGLKDKNVFMHVHMYIYTVYTYIIYMYVISLMVAISRPSVTTKPPRLSRWFCFGNLTDLTRNFSLHIAGTGAFWGSLCFC